MWMNLGMALAAVLFGVIGYYLSLIAKFYRLKFSRGPRGDGMLASLGALVLGMLLKVDYFAFLPSWIPALLICLGGISLSIFVYQLYRTMMSV